MRTTDLALAGVFAAAAHAKAMTGANIGGWMVLEPWITPSLFYRFLGKKHSDGIGMDSYTFCDALGKKANEVMRSHWDNWLKEEHFEAMAKKGIELVRLPIGDWTLKPYGAYEGCMDGAAEWIDKMLNWCSARNITVLLDVHTAMGSQNGYDNGGRAWKAEWNDEGTNFTHWPIRTFDWSGDWSGSEMLNINYAHMKWSLDQMEGMLQRWGSHSAVIGFEPVNEPDGATP